jgi:hypothetical protein
MMEERLIDVAESDVQLLEKIQNSGLVATGVANFQNQGICLKSPTELHNVVAVLGSILPAPGELHQYSA